MAGQRLAQFVKLAKRGLAMSYFLEKLLDQAKGIILRDSGGQGLEFLVGKKVSKKLEKLFWDSS